MGENGIRIGRAPQVELAYGAKEGLDRQELDVCARPSEVIDTPQVILVFDTN